MNELTIKSKAIRQKRWMINTENPDTSLRVIISRKECDHMRSMMWTDQKPPGRLSTGWAKPERTRLGNSAGALCRLLPFSISSTCGEGKKGKEISAPYTAVRRRIAESISRAVRARELRAWRFASVNLTGLELEVRGIRVVVTCNTGG